jgi:hypothetical protein
MDLYTITIWNIPMFGPVVKKGSTRIPDGSLGFRSRYRVNSGGTRDPSPDVCRVPLNLERSLLRSMYDDHEPFFQEFMWLLVLNEDLYRDRPAHGIFLKLIKKD